MALKLPSTFKSDVQNTIEHFGFPLLVAIGAALYAAYQDHTLVSIHTAVQIAEVAAVGFVVNKVHTLFQKPALVPGEALVAYDNGPIGGVSNPPSPPAPLSSVGAPVNSVGTTQGGGGGSARATDTNAASANVTFRASISTPDLTPPSPPPA